jgi:hypothetical protein
MTVPKQAECRFARLGGYPCDLSYRGPKGLCKACEARRELAKPAWAEKGRKRK